jgi:hypothetical protein
MDDEWTVGFRADTAGFRHEVGDLRQLVASSLGEGGAQAGRAIEASLVRATRAGQLGFEELKGVALRALADIAAAALRAGLQEALSGSGKNGGGGGGGDSTGAALARALGSLLGSPGRATGGPVGPGRPYMVGERGPELFVPTAAGRVETLASGAPREVRVAITVRAEGEAAAGALRQSAKQVARAVRGALEG